MSPSFFISSSTFFPASNMRFFSPRSSVWCKSRLQHQRSLATFSHLTISISIALMSLWQTSLKRRGGWPHTLLPLASSPYRKTFRILSSADCCFSCFAVAVNRRCSLISRKMFFLRDRRLPMQQIFVLYAIGVGQEKSRFQYSLEARKFQELPERCWT